MNIGDVIVEKRSWSISDWACWEIIAGPVTSMDRRAVLHDRLRRLEDTGEGMLARVLENPSHRHRTLSQR